MKKLKMLALTGMVAATIGTGALASAPSASALPKDECRYYLGRSQDYIREGGQAALAGNWSYASYCYQNAQYYLSLASAEC